MMPRARMRAQPKDNLPLVRCIRLFDSALFSEAVDAQEALADTTPPGTPSCCKRPAPTEATGLASSAPRQEPQSRLALTSHGRSHQPSGVVIDLVSRPPGAWLTCWSRMPLADRPRPVGCRHRDDSSSVEHPDNLRAALNEGAHKTQRVALRRCAHPPKRRRRSSGSSGC